MKLLITFATKHILDFISISNQGRGAALVIQLYLQPFGGRSIYDTRLQSLLGLLTLVDIDKMKANDVALVTVFVRLSIKAFYSHVIYLSNQFIFSSLRNSPGTYTADPQ